MLYPAGIKKMEVEEGAEHREIKVPHLQNPETYIKAVWEPSASDPNVVMLWAACCLGFLRTWEMTVPSGSS